MLGPPPRDWLNERNRILGLEHPDISCARIAKDLPPSTAQVYKTEATIIEAFLILFGEDLLTLPSDFLKKEIKFILKVNLGQDLGKTKKVTIDILLKLLRTT